MSYKVTISATHRFLSNSKRLAKKYASLKSDSSSIDDPELVDLVKEVQQMIEDRNKTEEE